MENEITKNPLARKRSIRWLRQFIGAAALVMLGSIGAGAFNGRNQLKSELHPISRTAFAAIVPISVVGADGAGEAMSPSRLLVVDGSCPISMQAMAALLADSIRIANTHIAYMPQPKRDPAAELETAALECARQANRLRAYVDDRLRLLDSAGRPVLASAARVGIDSSEFLTCLRSPATAKLLEVHAVTARSRGLWSLPALVSRDSAWIGSNAVTRLLK